MLQVYTEKLRRKSREFAQLSGNNQRKVKTFNRKVQERNVWLIKMAGRRLEKQLRIFRDPEFPAPISVDSQSPVAPIPEVPMPSSGQLLSQVSFVLYPHICPAMQIVKENHQNLKRNHLSILTHGRSQQQSSKAESTFND